MRRMLLILMVCGCVQEPGARAHDNDSGIHCTAPVRIGALPPVIREASGVAISRKHPGILWLHNDSGDPAIFAVDTLGNLRARILIDTPNRDWEDIAVASCPEGSCLYIGAIGDNLQQRTARHVYRLPEPALDAQHAAVTHHFQYRLPSGPTDIEALFVLPDQRMYLISKGRSGPITLYAFPVPADSSGINVLRELQRLTPGLVQLPDMVTGAGATPDGRVIAVRSYSALQLYTMADDRLQPLLPISGFDLRFLREPQGEGVDIGAGGTVYLVSEKGLDESDPPLSKVECKLSAR